MSGLKYFFCFGLTVYFLSSHQLYGSNYEETEFSKTEKILPQKPKLNKFPEYQEENIEFYKKINQNNLDTIQNLTFQLSQIREKYNEELIIKNKDIEKYRTIIEEKSKEIKELKSKFCISEDELEKVKVLEKKKNVKIEFYEEKIKDLKEENNILDNQLREKNIEVNKLKEELRIKENLLFDLKK